MTTSPLSLAFAETVRRLRTQRGLSQEPLAELTGLDRTYVSGIERGRRNVTLSTVERLVPALAPTQTELLQELCRTLHAQTLPAEP